MTEKRSISSVDSASDAAVIRPRLYEKEEEPHTFFVQTCDDSCIAIHRPKLRELAPNCWFTMTMNDPARGTDGDTQANPFRVPLPTWFVRDVADWSQPLSTKRVCCLYDEDTVREVLEAIGWSEDKQGDLPVCLAPRSPRVDILDETRLDSLLSPFIASQQNNRISGRFRKGTTFVTAIQWPHLRYSNATRSEISINSIIYASEYSHNTVCEIMGKDHGTHTRILIHDNGSREWKLINNPLNVYMLITDTTAI